MSYDEEAHGTTPSAPDATAGVGSMDAAQAYAASLRNQTQTAAAENGAGDNAAAQDATVARRAAQAAAEQQATDDQVIRAGYQQQQERASQDSMRNVQSMQGMEFLAFFIAMLFGLGDGTDGLGSSEALKQIANAFGADGDQFVNTIREYQSGDRSIASTVSTARALNRSVDVNNTDLEAARAAIREHGGENNPLLELIAVESNGGDYNIMFGGDRANLTDMTINEVLAYQQQHINNGHESGAAGYFQIIPKTLRSLVDDMQLTGNEKFDEDMQNRMGYALLERRGYSDYLSGEMSEADFAKGLAQEWASFPVLTDMRGHTRNVEAGQSYYAGVGSNKALVTPATLLATMRMAREDNMNPDRPGAFGNDQGIRERYDLQLASLGGAGLEIAGRGSNNSTNRAHMTAVHREAVARSPNYNEVIGSVSEELPHLAPHLHRFRVDDKLVIDREYAARLDGFMGEIEARGGTITSNEYNMVNVLGYRLENGGRTNGVLLNTPHLMGRAWDGKAEGVSPNVVADLAEKYGLGTVTPRQYSERGASFTHLDLSMSDRRYREAYANPMVVERPEEELLASLPNTGTNETPVQTASLNQDVTAGPMATETPANTATQIAFAEAMGREVNDPPQVDPQEPNEPLTTAFNSNPTGVDQIQQVAAAETASPEDVIAADATQSRIPGLGGSTSAV